MSDQSLGAVLWEYREHFLQSPRRRQHFTFLSGLSGRNRRLKLREVGPTEDVFCPKVAATFTFVCVVVEAGLRTAAVAWEAPAKRSSFARSGWKIDSRKEVLQQPVFQQ